MYSLFICYYLCTFYFYGSIKIVASVIIHQGIKIVASVIIHHGSIKIVASVTIHQGCRWSADTQQGTGGN